MSQKKLERMMIDSIFDELPAEKRDFFEEKLKRDPALQSEYAELQAILEETRALNAISNPPALSPEISARILAKARSEAEYLAARKNRPKFWSILPAFRYAFTTVLVASLAFWVGHERALRKISAQRQGSLPSTTDTIKPAQAPVAASRSLPESVPVQEVSMVEPVLAYHQNARIHVKAGDLQKALDYYEALLREYPGYRHRNQALLESGRVYAKRRQWDKAFENLQKVYDEYPGMRSQVTPHLYYVKQNLLPPEEAPQEVPEEIPQEVLDSNP